MKHNYLLSKGSVCLKCIWEEQIAPDTENKNSSGKRIDADKIGQKLVFFSARVGLDVLSEKQNLKGNSNLTKPFMIGSPPCFAFDLAALVKDL